jgi:hypothetical protein
VQGKKKDQKARGKSQSEAGKGQPAKSDFEEDQLINWSSLALARAMCI